MLFSKLGESLQAIMNKCYAIRKDEKFHPPEFTSGYKSREEAEKYLQIITKYLKDNKARYSVVFGTQYINRVKSSEGSYEVLCFAEDNAIENFALFPISNA